MSVLKLSTPGVYVQEISTLPPSVAEVETSIPAFIGYTEKALRGKDYDLTMIPTKISSLSEYNLFFGDSQPDPGDSIKLNIVDDGNGNYNVIAISDPLLQSKFNMAYAIRHYFDNGGGACYIVSVGPYEKAGVSTVQTVEDFKMGLKSVEEVDEVTLLVIPEAQSLVDNSGGVPDCSKYSEVTQSMIQQAGMMKDRFAIIDPAVVTEVSNKYPSGNIDNDIIFIRNSTVGADSDRYAAAYYPNLVTTYSRSVYMDNVSYEEMVTEIVSANDPNDPERKETKQSKVINKSEEKVYDIRVEEYVYVGKNINNDLKLQGKKLTEISGIYSTALYSKIKAEIAKIRVVIPPSPAIAGLYARVDKNKGVWKAPANESLFAVISPSVPISHGQQQSLNIDPNSGKSVNAIRTFPGFGTLVWGARTLNGNDNEWRYVSVRRFFNMVEESIKKSSQWAVFEPNTIDTWVKMEAMIGNYLFMKWKEGALAGAKPEQAYYVNVGLGKTMTSLDILEGRINVEIGMAVVRPAEFIVLKFSQMVQQS